MTEKRKASKRKGKIFWIILLVYVGIAFLRPVVSEIGQKLGSGSSSDAPYHNLRIQGVSPEVVAEYDGQKAEEGEQIYRFTVTIKNEGTREEELRNTLLYLTSTGTGYAVEIRKEKSASAEAKEDTRIIPPGREVEIVLHARVGDHAEAVEVVNYMVPEDEGEERFEVDFQNDSI